MFENTCNSNATGTPIIGLAATDAIAEMLNNASTTGIDQSKLKFQVFKDDFYTYLV